MQRRFLLLVMMLVIADALAKIVAYHFLSLEQEITISGFCSLTLVLNETGFGSVYQHHFGTGQNLRILSSAVGLLMTPSVILIQGRKWRFWLKVAAALLIGALLRAGALSASTILRLPKLDPWTLNLLTRLGSFPLMIALFAMSRS